MEKGALETYTEVHGTKSCVCVCVAKGKEKRRERGQTDKSSEFHFFSSVIPLRQQ